MKAISRTASAAASLAATAAFAQQFVYPAKGRSAEQQKKGSVQ
jgi:hypothetical protein